jgi:hypothetical protein
MTRTELQYGLIIGFGLIAWILAEYAAGFHTTQLEVGEYSGYFSIIIPLIALYMGIRSFRDKELGGSMTFLKGFAAGSRMSFIASVLISLFLALYITVINPEWIDLGLEYQRNKLVATGLSQQEVTNTLDLMKNDYTLSSMMLYAFGGTLLQGSVLSLIYSAILKRKPHAH